MNPARCGRQMHNVHGTFDAPQTGTFAAQVPNARLFENTHTHILNGFQTRRLCTVCVCSVLVLAGLRGVNVHYCEHDGSEFVERKEFH